MKEFFDQIQKSIYGPEYYKEVTTRPASYSWKYYWTLALLIALLTTIVTSIPLIPVIQKSLHTFPQQFFDYYPDELVVQINEGKITSNVVEPYYLSVPEMFKDDIAELPIKNLGVIDTQTPFSIDEFKAREVFFWITADSVAMQDDTGGINISPIAKEVSYIVSEDGLRGALTSIEPYFPFVIPIVVLLIFLGVMFSFVFLLLYLLIDAIFVFLMSKIMKWGFSYGTAFRLCLHATTLPILVSAIFSLLPLSFTLPFFSTFLLLIVVWLNFQKIPNASPVAPLPENLQ